MSDASMVLENTTYFDADDRFGHALTIENCDYCNATRARTAINDDFFY